MRTHPLLLLLLSLHIFSGTFAASDPSTNATGAKAEETTAQNNVLRIEGEIIEIEHTEETVTAAPPDPMFQTAMDAATHANATVKAAQEEADMWKIVLDKLIANAQVWGNVSKSEETLKLNASLTTTHEGTALMGERSKLEALRTAIATGKDNVQVSQLADSILEASSELRDGLTQLATYTQEYATTKQEFQTSLLQIGLLLKDLHSYELQSKAGVPASEELTTMKAEITTKQGFARAQKDRLLSLNGTMSEQKGTWILNPMRSQ